jgi:hypothetical protein
MQPQDLKVNDRIVSTVTGTVRVVIGHSVGEWGPVVQTRWEEGDGHNSHLNLKACDLRTYRMAK